MIVYPLILIFTLLLIYQICFLPRQDGFQPAAKLNKIKKAARNKAKQEQAAKKGQAASSSKIRSDSQFPDQNDGMSNMGDRVLKNHDEIVRIKAVLDTNYRPLIENSSGDPTNLLTRLATLESSVEALELAKLKEQEGKMAEFEGIEDTQK